MADCPICRIPDTDRQEEDGWVKFICPRCREFRLSQEVEEDLRQLFRAGDKGVYQRAVLSHAFQSMRGQARLPSADLETIERIIRNDRLPNAAIQADNAIRWLGSNLEVPEERSPITPSEMQAIIGALDGQGVGYIFNHLANDQKLIGRFSWGNMQGGRHVGTLGLTFDGWARFEELQHSTSESRTAFMAMSYHNEVLAGIVEDHFKPAIEQTGFDLQRLDDEPRPGLIDNRMRAEILASRFVVADLTDENLGAYWEAGFATGLEKPVFYTCERSKFEVDKTHFDTNHHYTILWDEENPDAAARELKTAIRAELRAEAKLTDD